MLRFQIRGDIYSLFFFGFDFTTGVTIVGVSEGFKAGSNAGFRESRSSIVAFSFPVENRAT